MSTRSASWSRPAERSGRVALAALCAAGVFAACWGLLHLHTYAHGQIRDPLDAAVQARRHRNIRIDRYGNSKAHSYAGRASTCTS